VPVLSKISTRLLTADDVPEFIKDMHRTFVRGGKIINLGADADSDQFIIYQFVEQKE
jgi:hypothetical protein